MGFAAIAAIGMLAGLCATAIAQPASTYLNKPIRIIVPFAPGGPADAIARIAATGLQQSLGQPVIVDNRTGAGGAVGADAVAKAAPDGYTLLLCNVGDTMSMSLYKSMPYDFERDFAPVSLLASSPFLIVVNPSVPANTLAELIQLAKAKPGTVTYGSAGTGVSSHLSGEAFSLNTGAKFLHVPYKGQAPAMTDLLGGQINFMFANPVTTLPQVRSGKLRALAITAPARFPNAPEIPTASEAGAPGFEAGTWFGIAAPARTPEAIVNRLSTELARILKSPEVRASLEAQGAITVASSPPEFERQIKADIAHWRQVINTAGIKLD
jgi:tripartite-type tricarboxylate transporter receptor subunit TctC